MRITDFVLRLLVLPFVFVLISVKFIYSVFYETFLFLRFGGEFINYKEKNSRKTIGDIFKHLKENNGRTIE